MYFTATMRLKYTGATYLYCAHCPKNLVEDIQVNRNNILCDLHAIIARDLGVLMYEAEMTEAYLKPELDKVFLKDKASLAKGRSIIITQEDDSTVYTASGGSGEATAQANATEMQQYYDKTDVFGGVAYSEYEGGIWW